MIAVALDLTCSTCRARTNECCFGCQTPTCYDCRPAAWPLLCRDCTRDVTTYFASLAQEQMIMQACRTILGNSNLESFN